MYPGSNQQAARQSAHGVGMANSAQILGTAPPIAAQPAIEHACNLLEAQIQAVSDAFYKLDGRLAPAKRPEPASAPTEEAAYPRATPLHGRIIDFVERLQFLEKRVLATQDLLEI